MDEIIFTRNATSAINLVARSFGEPRIAAGDEILITIMEHHANIVPWHFLRERKGAVLNVGADDRQRRARSLKSSTADHEAHEARRRHAHVECARHD